MDLASVRQQYEALARTWLKDGNEDSLGAAYDLGTSAYQEGGNLTELLAMHHDVLVAVLAECGEQRAAEFAGRGAKLLGEFIATFDFQINRLKDYQSSQQALTQRLRQQAQVLDRANEALRAARVEAEAATHAKAAFLAHMSHEIRTPLNAVIGLSGLLLETPLDDQQLDFARTVNTSGEHLLTVINDILDFSKIEAGKLELELLPMDLTVCIEETLDLVAVRAAAKNLELAYFIAKGTPLALRCDLGRIRQILLNLLSNAVKFTEQGEVMVNVTARQLEGTRHEWHFAVRDTGPGIPEPIRQKLFQPFEQGNASTTRVHGGTGLGLSISAQLVALLGGRVWIESEMGKGSTFHFTLLAEALEQVAAPNDPRSEQLRDRRILVVDDNPTNRQILSAYVEGWRMVPVEAETPMRALELLSDSRPFDLAILDYHMPGMNGTELAERMRRLPGRDGLPMILLSSVLAKQQAADRQGFSACLMKPIKPAPLYGVVAEILTDPVPTDGAHPPPALPTAELGQKHPLRILVAEDNAVNQKVAKLLLNKLGYAPSFAGNGLEVVDAVASQPFDLVLMDMQMPEMDGLQATSTLTRRFEARERPRIVAMTANATDEDRRACLAAGMDGYLSKPITIAKLEEVIRSCTARAERVAEPEPAKPVAKPAAPAAPVEAPEVLRLRSEFRGNPGELDRLTGRLLDETLGLRRAADRGDAESGRMHAARIGAIATALGFDRLRSAGERIGSLEGRQFLGAAVVLAADLQEQVEAARAMIREARTGIVGAAPPATAVAPEVLAHLKENAGPAAFGKLVSQFAQESAGLAEGLRTAVGRQDPRSIERVATELVTVCSPFQPPSLLAALRAMESAARSGDVASTRTLLTAVHAELERVRHELAR